MLKFNEKEYRTSADLIRSARKKAEEVADEVCKEGFSNIFFTAVGGSFSPMMSIYESSKQLTTLPIYFEQAAELLARGHKCLNQDSLVITLSKSGDTKETVEIAKKLNAENIRVICCTKNLSSPLANHCKYVVPMQHENGVEYEYIVLYWVFFRILYNKGQFDDYESFADSLSALPENLLKIKAQFEPKAEEIAKEHYNAPIQYWIGSAEMWSEVYLFSMCILEEMQWIKTKSVTSAEFFHGTLELIEKDTSVFLVKSEGKCRVLDERVERFVSKYSDKLVVIDTAEYALDGVDSKFRWLIAPLMVSTCLVDRLAFHFEKYTKHDLDFRRYYRQFEY